MAKKRASGEGTLRHRADGRWESAITVGYKTNGQPERNYFYGKTQTEVKEKVLAWKKTRPNYSIQGGRNYRFSEWADMWFIMVPKNRTTIAKKNVNMVR